VGEQKHLVFDVCAPLFFEMPHAWQWTVHTSLWQNKVTVRQRKMASSLNWKSGKSHDRYWHQ